MKKLLGIAAAAVIAFSLALSLSPEVADAQAFVSNKADGQACIAFLPPNIYTGPAVLVITPSGNVMFDCQGDLIFGPGVSGGAVVTRGVGGPLGTTCKTTENSAGKMNATCH